MGELSDFWNEAPSKTLEHFGDHVFTDVLPVRLVWSGLNQVVRSSEMWKAMVCRQLLELCGICGI